MTIANTTHTITPIRTTATTTPTITGTRLELEEEELELEEEELELEEGKTSNFIATSEKVHSNKHSFTDLHINTDTCIYVHKHNMHRKHTYRYI